jgi:heat-inducible transcriptional repressor
MLDDRKSLVLQALVEEYIRTGEPVSSQAILARSGLDVSSATIRNDLARLESYGFVDQPHASAGRVPTHQGYRFYVDHCSPGRLRAATRQRIERFFADVHQEVTRLLRDTSGLLSDITHFPAVVVGPTFDDDEIHGIHLVRVGGTALLVVTVAGTGRVSQQVVDLGFETDDRQLEDAERVLLKTYAGRTLSDVSGDDTGLRGLSEVVRRVVLPVHDQLQARSEHTEREIYIGGTSQLAGLWSDLAIVSQMLGILDEKATLQQMIEGDDRVTVRIGAELGDDIDMAVIAAPFGTGTRKGRIGVIGPMRMDYRRTISVVERIGENLGESLEQGE